MTKPNLKDVVLTICLRRGCNSQATLGELAKVSGLSVREVADRLRETGVRLDLPVNSGERKLHTKASGSATLPLLSERQPSNSKRKARNGIRNPNQ